jgi:tetratricopeptide (TPR) repeat protein
LVTIRWLPVLLLLCSGCSTSHRGTDRFANGITLQNSVELEDTAFYPQDQFQCGPAALATALQSSGITIQPSELISTIYLPKRHGSLQTEIVSTSRSYGRLAYIIKPDINALINELLAGHPVLVLQNLGLRLLPVWHYAVVIGYSPKLSEIILRSGTTRRKTMSVNRFMKTWSAANNWGLLVLKPTQLPADNNAERFLKSVADLEDVGQHAASLPGYETAVTQWPKNPTAWFGLGNAHYHNRLFDSAETAYRQTIALQPDHLPALNNLAMTLAELNRSKAAQELINRALANLSPHAPMYQTLLQTRREIIHRLAK